MTQVAIADTSETTFDASSGTVSHVVGAGEGLVVLIILGVIDANKEVQSVVWDAAGVNEPLAKPAAVAPYDESTNIIKRLEVWHLANPTAKTALVTVTIEGGNAQKTDVLCISAQNLHTTVPFSDRVISTSAGGSAPSASNITCGANDLAIMFFAHELKDNTFTPGAGDVELADFNAHGDHRFGCYTSDATGEVTVSASTGASGKYAVLGFCLEEAPVASDLPPGLGPNLGEELMRMGISVPAGHY